MIQVTGADIRLPFWFLFCPAKLVAGDPAGLRSERHPGPCV